MLSVAKALPGFIWHAFGNERKVARRIGRPLQLNPEDTFPVHQLVS